MVTGRKTTLVSARSPEERIRDPPGVPPQYSDLDSSGELAQASVRAEPAGETTSVSAAPWGSDSGARRGHGARAALEGDAERDHGEQEPHEARPAGAVEGTLVAGDEAGELDRGVDRALVGVGRRVVGLGLLEGFLLGLGQAPATVAL